MQKEKQIQIPELLYIKLCQYFLLDQQGTELEESIIQGLNDKLDRYIDHELYTKSKTAPTFGTHFLYSFSSLYSFP